MKKPIIRVLICDNESLLCDALKLIVNLESDMKVVAVAKDGHNGLILTKIHKPDIVLMDIKMPGMSGIETTRLIHQDSPNTKVLILTTYGYEQLVINAFRAGAFGYLLKNSSRNQIVNAIRGSVENKTFIDPAIARGLVDQIIHSEERSLEFSWQNQLTKRELETLILLGQGSTTRQIAHSLSISEGTARNYVTQIVTKLEVEDRTQAAVFAWKTGLCWENES